jgi:hypothetical protein
MKSSNLIVKVNLRCGTKGGGVVAKANNIEVDSNDFGRANVDKK